MSVQDIMKYVRQTPGNTNPSVIASMVNAEMNSTLEEAKKYTDSQRIAYTIETPCKVSWFGDTTGLAVLPGEMLDIGWDFYQVSKEIVVSYDNVSMYYNISDKLYFAHGTYVVEEPGVILLYCSSPLGNDALHAIVLSEDISEEITAGVYFAKKEATYLSSIFGLYIETVHQIDPKFIPSPFPTITLSTVLYDETDNELTPQENALLDEAFAQKCPVIITVTAILSQVDMVMTMICSNGSSSIAGVSLLSGKVGDISLEFLKMGDSSWIAKLRIV